MTLTLTDDEWSQAGRAISASILIVDKINISPGKQAGLLEAFKSYVADHYNLNGFEIDEAIDLEYMAEYWLEFDNTITFTDLTLTKGE